MTHYLLQKCPERVQDTPKCGSWTFSFHLSERRRVSKIAQNLKIDQSVKKKKTMLL